MIMKMGAKGSVERDSTPLGGAVRKDVSETRQVVGILTG